MTPTQEELKQLLHYCPDTGKFTWKVRAAHRIQVGDPAGSLNTRLGYIQLRVKSHLFYAHRLAVLYMTGQLQLEKQVDHINGSKADNRWANLRIVDQLDNLRNASRSKANTSGVTGVHWDAAKQKWCARLMKNRKHIFLGYFDTVEEAAQARKDADPEHGFHLNHGRTKQ